MLFCAYDSKSIYQLNLLYIACGKCRYRSNSQDTNRQQSAYHSFEFHKITSIKLIPPVYISKQFGGRSKTGSHTRPEQTVSDCVWLFHLPGRKDATLMMRGDRQYGPAGPYPRKSGAFRVNAGIAVLPEELPLESSAFNGLYRYDF